MKDPLKAIPEFREDPKTRSLNGGSYKEPLVVWGPKLGVLLSRSFRGSGMLLSSHKDPLCTPSGGCFQASFQGFLDPKVRP